MALPVLHNGGEGSGDLPGAVTSVLRPGDVASYPQVEPGEVTVCAAGLTGNLGDKDYMARVTRHVWDHPLGCVTVVVHQPDQAVVVQVPPIKRLPDN